MVDDNSNVEEQVIDSNIDNELRSEISQAKALIDKKWIYLGIAAVAVIVIGLLVYFLAFAGSKSTVSFYYNNDPVTINLNVKITFDGVTTDYVTDKNVLFLSGLPSEDKKFTLEVTNKDYEFKKDYFGGSESYRVDIKKILDLTDDDPKPVNVSFSVYTSSDSFNVYASPVTLSLKCLTSGKTDSLIVTGSSTYSKAADCGALNISTNVSGFSPYTGTCSEAYCSVKLSEFIQAPATITKNNLIIYAVDKADQFALKDVNVTVTRYGFTQTLKTDALGKVEFVDLETGQYTVSANVLYDGTNFSKTDIVSVTADALAITRTLEFNFLNTNIIYLLIDANVDLECQFVVEIFDANSNSVFPGDGSEDDFPIFDANIKNEISFDDLNNGIYYMTVAPIDDDCKYIYAPIYNKKLEYPADSDLIVKMLPFDKKSMVFLSVNLKPNYSGVSIKVREADNNRYILNDMDPFILYQDKNYVIEGESSFASGSMPYKYNKNGKTSDADGYYNDTVTLNMEIDGVTVTVNANIFDDVNTNFDVLATWTLDGKEKFYLVDGEQGFAEVPVDAGVDVLIKLTSKQILLLGEPDEITVSYNYYLNNFRFNKDQKDYDIDVTISDDLLTSLIVNKVKQISSDGNYFVDEYLTKYAKDTNLSNNKNYFIPFDVLGQAYAKDSDNTCVQEEKQAGIGFVFSASGSDYNMDINDILAYTHNSIAHATKGFDFKPVFIAKENKDFEINIFRVLVDTRINNLVKNSKGNINYGVDYGVPENNLGMTNQFTIGTTIVGNNVSKNILDVNLFVPTEGQIVLELKDDVKKAIQIGVNYIVKNAKWSARNAYVGCDPSSDDVETYITLLGLDGALLNNSLDSLGKVTANINPDKDSLKSTILPLKLDLILDLNILNEKSNSSFNTSMPITLKLNRGDYPQVDCLTISLNNKNLNWKSVLENDSLIVYNGDKKINSLSLSDIPSLSGDNTSNLFFDVTKLLNAFTIYFQNGRGIDNFLDIFQVDDLDSILTILNFNLIFEQPKNLSIINNCALWDFDVNSSLFSQSKSIKYGANTNTYILLTNNDLNILDLYVTYKNNFDNETSNVFKPQSSYLAVYPKPVDDLFKLPSSMRSNVDGNIIPLEIDYTKPDCTKNICSKELFDNLLNNTNIDDGYVYLLDDNFNDYVGFTQYGKYHYQSNNQLDYNFYSISDHVFYHLPIKTSDYQDNYSDNIGSCVNGQTVSYNKLQYSNCSDHGLESFKEVKYDVNILEFGHVFSLSNYNKLTSVLAGKLFSVALSNQIDLYVTPGYKFLLCADSGKSNCFKEDYNKIMQNKSGAKINYFLYYAGHYYNPYQLMVLMDGNLYDLVNGYQILTFTNANNLDPNSNNMNNNLKYSVLNNTTGNYDLSKVVDHFNKGNIGYYYDSANKGYYYNWDLNKIFKNETMPIILRDVGNIFVINANSPTFGYSGNRSVIGSSRAISSSNILGMDYTVNNNSNVQVIGSANSGYTSNSYTNNSVHNNTGLQQGPPYN